MSTINKDGMLVASKVSRKRITSIEHGKLKHVHAIVVHQTDAPTIQHTFNSYKSGGNGAHFLIGKNGDIYQTASVYKRCYHVGRLIKSKCLAINRNTCNSPSIAQALAMSWTKQINALNKLERAKQYPARYPVNSDSIGIELVGQHVDQKTYEVINSQQNSSLQWLVSELHAHFNLTSKDVYKHPEVSYKHPGEAQSAVWQ